VTQPRQGPTCTRGHAARDRARRQACAPALARPIGMLDRRRWIGSQPEDSQVNAILKMVSAPIPMLMMPTAN
jgi:hypothetical protein